MLTRILSGGQTGVDRAALDVARDFGLARGGWCPKGRKAEDGKIDAVYPLEETPSADYAQRTEWNVRDADGTLVLSWGKPDGGTALTLEIARRLEKPLLHFDLTVGIDPRRFEAWVDEEGIAALNVAGPRESREPGKIHATASGALRTLLAPYRRDPAHLYDPPFHRDAWQVEAAFPKRDLVARLGERFPALTKEAMERVFWHGGFYVNQKRMSFGKLPADVASGSKIEVFRFLREPEEISVDERHVLWDESGVLAVDKPAWLPTQATRVSERFSLEETLRRWLKNPKISAAHRLDRQTSGVVLFSKTPEAHAALTKQFEDRSLRKSYLAVVAPAPKEAEWTASGYLCRDLKRSPQIFYRLRRKKTGRGRWSETHFFRLATREDGALVAAEPVTGRTHQIRVHLAHGGTPVAGDFLYGKNALAAPRIQLHSHRIAFRVEGPMGGERSVTASVPADFLWRV
ncbi:MAG TPA: putative molybdenum carrier protein [bacterium]|nr:putative molybdenum carrier protein [bacterium]